MVRQPYCFVKKQFFAFLLNLILQFKRSRFITEAAFILVIMKHHPSITKEVTPNVHIYAFDKLDGSQIRAEWNTKRGFYKFGTKNQMIDATHKPWGKGIQLVNDKYGEDLAMVFKEHKWRDVICFFELHGPSSFAGTHNFEEELTVTLFDVNPYKRGILEPYEFIRFFGHLDTPKVLYEGPVSVTLFDKVKQSTLPGMTFEGVVCKGPSQNNAQLPIMFKVKSKAWLDRLHDYCKGNQNLYSMLE